MKKQKPNFPNAGILWENLSKDAAMCSHLGIRKDSKKTAKKKPKRYLSLISHLGEIVKQEETELTDEQVQALDVFLTDYLPPLFELCITHNVEEEDE